MEYTKDVHARRLLKMLNKKDPINCCPAQKYFVAGSKFLDDTRDNHGRFSCCNICLDFVNLKITDGCPCYKLGISEAIKRTWIALEEYFNRGIK
jgi:hypothetical protein